MKESPRIRDERKAAVCASCDIISIDFSLPPRLTRGGVEMGVNFRLGSVRGCQTDEMLRRGR